MNRLSDKVAKGTFGELLVQLRLLQYDVQAAPPIKDSGNDLIAIRGEVFRAIQVKTRTEFPRRVYDLPGLYHVLAIVVPDPESTETELSLDRCLIFLFSRQEVDGGWIPDGDQYLISQERINLLF